MNKNVIMRSRFVKVNPETGECTFLTLASKRENGGMPEFCMSGREVPFPVIGWFRSSYAILEQWLGSVGYTREPGMETIIDENFEDGSSRTVHIIREPIYDGEVLELINEPELETEPEILTREVAAKRNSKACVRCLEEHLGEPLIINGTEFFNWHPMYTEEWIYGVCFVTSDGFEFERNGIKFYDLLSGQVFTSSADAFEYGNRKKSEYHALPLK